MSREISTQGTPSSFSRRSDWREVPWAGQIASPSALYSRMVAMNWSWRAGSSSELAMKTVRPRSRNERWMAAVSSVK